MSISQITLDETGGVDGSVIIKNTGEGIIFARLILEGVPEVGDQSSVSNNLQLDVRFSDMRGYSLDVSQLEQGTDFMAIVTVKNPGLLYAYTDIALTQIFPSGWEILNTRMYDYSSGIESDIPKYQDIRDDRVYTYFDLDNYREKKFVVLLNAAYLGEFYLPTTYSEAMYNNMINARIPGMWVEIIRPGN
jgi:uncharacterized protein YfaS (alpha-2-macroglobulin family)